VVFKLGHPDDNSGVFIRIPERPQTPWDAVNKGYEIQIDNTENEWHRTGCLYSLTKAKATVSPKVGEWSTMLITLDHKRTLVKIDGQLVTDFTEGSAIKKKKEWMNLTAGSAPSSAHRTPEPRWRRRFTSKEVSVRPLER
jgi:hypothetical protein